MAMFSTFASGGGGFVGGLHARRRRVQLPGAPGLAAVARPGRGATSATRKPEVMAQKDQCGRRTQQISPLPGLATAARPGAPGARLYPKR